MKAASGITGISQASHCRLDDGSRVSRHLYQRIAFDHGDAQVLGLQGGRKTQRHRRDLGVMAIGPGDDAERRLEILDRARQRAEHAHGAGGPRPARQIGHVTAPGHAPFGRLQRKDAVVVRGIAHRTADVAADLERRQACRHRDRAATGRAAGRPWASQAFLVVPNSGLSV
jgi:hypothetical protein